MDESRIADKLTFTTTIPLYQLAKGTTQRDILDQITARLEQLSAMLTVVTGSGHETFRNLPDDIQGSYLWSCKMIARECKDLAEHLDVEKLGAAA